MECNYPFSDDSILMIGDAGEEADIDISLLITKGGFTGSRDTKEITTWRGNEVIAGHWKHTGSFVPVYVPSDPDCKFLWEKISAGLPISIKMITSPGGVVFAGDVHFTAYNIDIESFIDTGFSVQPTSCAGRQFTMTLDDAVNPIASASMEQQGIAPVNAGINPDAAMVAMQETASNIESLTLASAAAKKTKSKFDNNSTEIA